MGRKGRGAARAAAASSLETVAPAPPVDRGALASCLNATSQIAAECNSILRDLLRGRCAPRAAPRPPARPAARRPPAARSRHPRPPN
jgi:hypothetical protein